MIILSYEGPSARGVVSDTLTRVLSQSAVSHKWCFLHNEILQLISANSNEQSFAIPPAVIEGHKRYCKEFLLPLLHDLPPFVNFEQADRHMYAVLNEIFALSVVDNTRLQLQENVFINDYQLALCPWYFANSSSVQTSVYWYEPWPNFVEGRFITYLMEVAVGLLRAKRLTFHIKDYKQRFLSFVDCYMPGYEVDFASSKVFRPDKTVVEILAQPLGFDDEYWQYLGKQRKPKCTHFDLNKLTNKPFVLSVDSVDDAQGIIERLQGIEHFLCANPNQIGKVRFIQVCQRASKGLSNFDDYWLDCRVLTNSINKRWGIDDWQPIVWLEEPIADNFLAWLYKHAKILLLTPLHDGLNLATKEFPFCSLDGVLILSVRSGFWSELSESVLTLVNLRPDTIAEQIAYGLSMSKRTRVKRIAKLRSSISLNSLRRWWENVALHADMPTNVFTLPAGFATKAIRRNG